MNSTQSINTDESWLAVLTALKKRLPKLLTAEAGPDAALLEDLARGADLALPSGGPKQRMEIVALYTRFWNALMGVENTTPGLLGRFFGPPGNLLLTPHAVETEALRVQLDMDPEDEIPFSDGQPLAFAEARQGADRAVEYLVEVAGPDPSVLTNAMPALAAVGTVPVLAGPLATDLARGRGLCLRNQEPCHLVVSLERTRQGTEPEFAALWSSPTGRSMAWIDFDRDSFKVSSMRLDGPFGVLARPPGSNVDVTAAVENAIVRFLVDATHDVAGPRGEAWYGLRRVAFGDLPREIANEIGYCISPPGQPLLRATSERNFYQARLDPCDLAAYIMQTVQGGIGDRAAALLYPEDTLMKRAALAFAQQDPQFAFDRAPEPLWPLIAAYRAQTICDADADNENWPLLAEIARALGMQVAPQAADQATDGPASGASHYPNWRAACNDVHAKIAQQFGQFN
nr:hypothetical protein [Pandoravirus massiliensis]